MLGNGCQAHSLPAGTTKLVAVGRPWAAWLTAGLDTDGLLLASGLVLGAHVHDAVGVDVKGHLANTGRVNAAADDERPIMSTTLQSLACTPQESPRQAAGAINTTAQPAARRAPHLDLRHAARRRGDAHEVKLAQELVVGRHLALSLEHLDAHLGGEGGGVCVWGGG